MLRSRSISTEMIRPDQGKGVAFRAVVNPATSIDATFQVAIPQLDSPPESARCSEPGCVFPAWDAATGRCRYHVVVEEEAEKFESSQPILEILRLYKVRGPDPEIEEYRRQQKRMQATVRELFLSGVA